MASLRFPWDILQSSVGLNVGIFLDHKTARIYDQKNKDIINLKSTQKLI
jgi:hypothetical protein